MLSVAPASAKELADCLKDAASRSRSISVIGNDSKHLMAGPPPRANVSISTARLNRVLRYEPNDLTISAEAGLRWADLQKALANKGQMVALDPPFWEQATVGGVVASNSNGPLRKNFGTARDLIIGMQFATLDGKIVRVGGMVVKNVAGLDIGKLMIGSFGTLAVITSVNFRLHALPEETNTFLFSFADLDRAIQKRDELLSSVLRPLALDLVTPSAAARLGLRGFVLALRAGGSGKMLARYARDLGGSNQLSGADDHALWTQIREFPADFLVRQPGGVILRISTLLGETSNLLRLISGAAITRAASGVSYIFLSSWQFVASLWQAAAQHDWTVAVEFAPDDIRSTQKLWHASTTVDSSFAMMEKIKKMFDPGNLLNRSRLYGRI
ncbi:MAG: FAD-binding oxidoreductase [Acidobacteriaceae bacterium]|nr:FAD-binding oxidoreductase [Acidobacteriaceae bacterium]